MGWYPNRRWLLCAALFHPAVVFAQLAGTVGDGCPLCRTRGLLHGPVLNHTGEVGSSTGSG